MILSADVYQQGGMAVSSDSLVHCRQSVFGTKVDVSPSLHQDPDGLARARLALHRQGQGRL